MARASLAIATAILAAMTVLASAQGPSFESRGYGGPLYVGPNFQSGGQHTSPAYGPKSSSEDRYKKKRATRAAKERKAPAAEEADTAKSSPVESSGQSENSSISLASPDTDKTPDEKSADTSKGIDNENSTISRASLDGKEPTGKDTGASEQEDAPVTTQNVGCKKYFPSAGMTLSVPCE